MVAVSLKKKKKKKIFFFFFFYFFFFFFFFFYFFFFFGCFFFFQAEDGIRDRDVTGVQTCALPISNHETFYVHDDSAEKWCNKNIVFFTMRGLD